MLTDQLSRRSAIVKNKTSEDKYFTSARELVSFSAPFKMRLKPEHANWFPKSGTESSHSIGSQRRGSSGSIARLAIDPIFSRINCDSRSSFSQRTRLSLLSRHRSERRRRLPRLSPKTLNTGHNHSVDDAGRLCYVASIRTVSYCCFLDSLRLVDISNNLGNSKSLVTHPAPTTHSRLKPEERAALGIGDGLVRLSAGLEGEADLLADLERALAAV